MSKKDFELESFYAQQRKEIYTVNREMIEKGFQWKVTASIHPIHGGDDKVVDFFYTQKPTKAQIIKQMKQQKSAILDSYTQPYLIKMPQKYEVVLKSCGNIDHGENPGGPVSPTMNVMVDSLKAAQILCRGYIKEHDLGGGNWIGGQVHDCETGFTVAQISYNGRVWDYMTEEEIIVEEQDKVDNKMKSNRKGATIMEKVMLNEKELMELKMSELVTFHNRLNPPTPAKAKTFSTKKKAVAKILELQEALKAAKKVDKPKPAAKKVDKPKPAAKKVDKSAKVTVVSLAKPLLREKDNEGNGLPYATILDKIKETLPEAKTSVACLRWYASRMQEEGEILPARPRKNTKASK